MSAGEQAMTLKAWGKSIGVSSTTAWRKFVAGEVEAINVGSLARPRLRVTQAAAADYLRNNKIVRRAA